MSWCSGCSVWEDHWKKKLAISKSPYLQTWGIYQIKLLALNNFIILNISISYCTNKSLKNTTPLQQTIAPYMTGAICNIAFQRQRQKQAPGSFQVRQNKLLNYRTDLIILTSIFLCKKIGQRWNSSRKSCSMPLQGMWLCCTTSLASPKSFYMSHVTWWPQWWIASVEFCWWHRLKIISYSYNMFNWYWWSSSLQLWIAAKERRIVQNTVKN